MKIIFFSEKIWKRSKHVLFVYTVEAHLLTPFCFLAVFARLIKVKNNIII